MKKYLWRYETVAVSAIGLFCAYFLVQTYNYGHKAALFPRLVCSIVLFLILVFIISSLRRRSKRGEVSSQAKPVRTEGIAEAGQPQGVKWTLTFGLAMGFCLLMYLIGFGLATFCYLALHTRLAGYRKGKVIFFFALAVAGIMVFFGGLFHISLPEGILVTMIMQYWQTL
jgi:hypothetical protein